MIEHEKITNKYFSAFLLGICIYLLLPTIAGAVDLYLKSSQNSYFPNEIFQTEIRLNVNPGENVTAIDGKIKYNPQDLKVIEFLTGNSILTFVDQPTIDKNNGVISFSGIIPGGYTGRLPGDPGESNLLGTVAFQVLKTNNLKTQIEVLNNSKIYLNDGQELKTNIVLKKLEININEKEVVFNPLNELEKITELDKIPPEDFQPEITQIDNNYFLIFNTTDKQSGIDHYNLQFLHRNFWGKYRVINEIANITSPYLLEKELIKKPIQVVAFDKAGNERKAILNPFAELRWYQNYLVWGIILLGIIGGYILWRIRKFKVRNTKS